MAVDGYGGESEYVDGYKVFGIVRNIWLAGHGFLKGAAKLGNFLTNPQIRIIGGNSWGINYFLLFIIYLNHIFI